MPPMDNPASALFSRPGAVRYFFSISGRTSSIRSFEKTSILRLRWAGSFIGCPSGITMIIGFAFFSARRLSRKVGPADLSPSGVRITAAVQQVQNGIACSTRLVPRRSVNVQPPHPVRCLGHVPLDVKRAVRDRPESVKGGLVTRYVHHALRGGRQASLHKIVLGIEHLNAVHQEEVRVQVGTKRSSGERPDAILFARQLLHRRIGHPVATQLHHLGFGSIDAERHGVIRVDVRRLQCSVRSRRRLLRLGIGGRTEHEGKQAELAHDRFMLSQRRW